MAKILFVEDDQGLAEMVLECLFVNAIQLNIYQTDKPV